MLASLVNSASKIGDYAYSLAYGHELNGTPANLKWALQQNPQDVLKYSFKEDFQTYSILEYAVKGGDAAAVKTLLELGADWEFSEASRCLGNIVHFYITDLKKNIAPNLEVLNLLLDKFSDETINDESGGDFYTSLEFALERMSHFERIHWDVIETLLKRGVRITSRHYFTPFQVLQNSANGETEVCSPKNIHKEIRLLRSLSEYLDLEKKYYPNTQSGLTLEQFKLLIPSCIALFNKGAVSMASVPFISGALSSLSDMPEAAAGPDGKDSCTQEQLDEYKSMIQPFQNSFSQGLSTDYQKFNMVIVYYQYFQKLVKAGEFKDCFEKWALASIVSALQSSNVSAAQDSNRKDALWLMSQFNKMGLLPKEQN